MFRSDQIMIIYNAIFVNIIITVVKFSTTQVDCDLIPSHPSRTSLVWVVGPVVAGIGLALLVVLVIVFRYIIIIIKFIIIIKIIIIIIIVAFIMLFVDDEGNR